MILCSHAVVGAALASFLPSHPAAAFVIGFASHFVLDAIPHRDYRIKSRAVNPKFVSPVIVNGAFLRDVVPTGADALSGSVAAVFLFGPPASVWAIRLGAIGAMLPDPLRLVHRRLPHEPLRTLQRFHRWAHTDSQIKGFVLGF